MNKTHTIRTRVTEKDYDRVQRQAKREMVPDSIIVRKAVVEYLSKHEPPQAVDDGPPVIVAAIKRLKAARHAKGRSSQSRSA